MPRFLSFALCGMILSSSICIGEEDARERLMNEAPPAWTIQEKLCRNVVGVLNVTQKQTGMEPNVNRYTFAINGDSIKAEVEGSTIPIRAINTKYLFGLKCNHDGKSYSVHTLEANDSLSPAAVEAVNFQINQLRSFAGMSHRFLDMPLSQLLLNSDFKISSVSYVDGDDGQFVRIDFEYHARDPTDRVEEGSFLVLDSQNHWRVAKNSVVRKALVEVEGAVVKRPIRWNSAFEYGEPRDGIQVVKRSVALWDEPDLGFEIRYVYEFEEFERAVVPESEFTLSAYGLPEPDMTALRSRVTLPQLLQDAMCHIGQAAAARQLNVPATVDEE